MKKINTLYWVFTILFCAAMFFSAIPEIRQTSEAKVFMDHLGYPDYFNPFIGVLKVLGVLALLVPGYRGIKEWAYAGFFFDLSGAVYSQIAKDGFMPQIAFMLIFFLLWGLSYGYFRRKYFPSEAI